MSHSYRIVTIVFVILIILTLFSWSLGKWNQSGHIAFAILLGSAVIKNQLIGEFFMGLRQVAGFWRWVISLWMTITASLIAIAFYL